MLNWIEYSGARLVDYGKNDCLSASIETQGLMYFGDIIGVLERSANSLTITYKSRDGIFKDYLEALLMRYRKCFFKNVYKEDERTDCWMARVVKGKVEVVAEDMEDLLDYEVV
jgi:hypothetical protein